jgi:hypothetical protein
MFPTSRERSVAAPVPAVHPSPSELRKDVDIPVVVAGRDPGAEQRDIYDVPMLPCSVDFQGTVESVALAHESHVEVSLWEDDHRIAAAIVPVRPGSARPVHLHGIPTRTGIHELRVRARVGAASVRGRIVVEHVASG